MSAILVAKPGEGDMGCFPLLAVWSWAEMLANGEKRRNQCMVRSGRILAAGFILNGCVASTIADLSVPAGFEAVVMSPALDSPTAMAFAPDGRIFIAQKNGIVRVVQDGNLLPEPFIDLTQEVGDAGDRGLLGIALSPDFATNRQVYLLYTVDPSYGAPDESGFEASYGRLTRYTGTIASNGSVANTTLRAVVLGQTSATGIPICWSSHTIGALRWGLDGSLLVSAGDGARFEGMDAGDQTPDCLSYLPAGHDVGAFRAQLLNSPTGKILRINPVDGRGLPDNPYFDEGNPDLVRSKVWVNGLRNPFRFTVRPNTPAPGAVFVGDVGWNTHEELSYAPKGANMGWPCYEAFSDSPMYPFANPPAGGCSTIEAPGNPGPLTFPLMSTHHSNPASSVPPGSLGQAIVCGVFSPNNNYPQPFRRGLFIADFSQGCINVLQVDDDQNFIALHDFATGANGPTDFAVDPLTGDVCVLELMGSRVVRFHNTVEFVPSDINQDGVVDVSDLLAVIGGWGPCPSPCPVDVNSDGITNVEDLLEVIGHWG